MCSFYKVLPLLLLCALELTHLVLLMYFLFADQLMEEFRGHSVGIDPTPKWINNVSSKIFRIKHFIGFMSAGQTNLASLTFLDNRSKVRYWLSFLRQCKISEPTVHHYLKNVAQFLQYLNETPPPTCWLSRVALVGLKREIRNLIRLVRCRMVVQELDVKQAKEARLIPKATLRACRESAKHKIPEILGKFSTPLTSYTLASDVTVNASLFSVKIA